jgi:hypothetical protein
LWIRCICACEARVKVEAVGGGVRTLGMTGISADAALAVVPFFAPLAICVFGLLYALARSQTDTARRLELVEQKVDIIRATGAKAPRVHFARSLLTTIKESGGP